jgi:lipoyl(octanoyl) transferase
MSDKQLRWSYFGEIPYARALELQCEIKARVTEGLQPMTLLLLEHPAVITLGRSAQREHVLLTTEQLAIRGIDCVDVDRGGDVTYHAPGQLVGYLIRKVGRSVRRHVDLIIDVLEKTLAQLGIEAWYEADAPGLWTKAGKVAAIGIDARGGTTMHGFALNLRINPEDFGVIVPCGIPRPVTSVQALLDADRAPTPEALSGEVAHRFCSALKATAQKVDPLEICR